MKVKFYIGSLIVALLISTSAFGQVKSASKDINNMVNVLKNNTVQTNFGLSGKNCRFISTKHDGHTFLMQGISSHSRQKRFKSILMEKHSGRICPKSTKFP